MAPLVLDLIATRLDWRFVFRYATENKDLRAAAARWLAQCKIWSPTGKVRSPAVRLMAQRCMYKTGAAQPGRSQQHKEHRASGGGQILPGADSPDNQWLQLHNRRSNPSCG